jgi:asparagine synthase (glutamine-hydrolysing)
MCGIVGAVGGGKELIVNRELADAMCQVIEHRGPDDRGVRYAPPAFIGMQRLSIIDLESGDQPIHNEDKSIWVVFNGEIYNYRELRKELEACGHRFYTHSDSECIVHAYEQYGERCFERFRGMFAIAIWDQNHERLVLARDRLGKKPLYYAHVDGNLVFGSELKSLLLVPGVGQEMLDDAIYDYMLYGYVPTPRSIFADVNKLPPGYSLRFENDRISLQRYWQLSFQPKWQGDEAELTRQLHDQLDDAVRARLVSDVPFGAFLSGGLDSSVVVALMARHMNRPVKTFSIGFKEEAYNELNDARQVAQHVGAEHHELVVDPEAVGLTEKLVWHFDEPFADSSAIPTYLVAEMAAHHVKMVLSGDGGDEAFAGYERYRKYATMEQLRRLLPLGLPGGLRTLGRGIPGRFGKRLTWLGERLGLPYPEDYLSGVALSTPQQAATLLGRPEALDAGYGDVAACFSQDKGVHHIDRIVGGDVTSYLLDDILVKVDRMTMANSLEARAPLLDHELVEFAARLPVSMKMRSSGGKYLLRQVARSLLPESVLAKRKQGFAIPLSEWFRTSLRGMLQDLVTSRAFRERGVFDPAAVERNIAEHLRGEADHGEHLWLVLNFELWARRFLDERAGLATAFRGNTVDSAVGGTVKETVFQGK